MIHVILQKLCRCRSFISYFLIFFSSHLAPNLDVLLMHFVSGFVSLLAVLLSSELLKR